MNKIIVLKKPPIVFTKDKSWEPKIKIEPGAIFYLPEDAILLEAQED